METITEIIVPAKVWESDPGPVKAASSAYVRCKLAEAQHHMSMR